MIEKLLKTKEWDADTTTKFFKALVNLSDEEKCVVISDTSKELMKRGGQANLSAVETILVSATQCYFNVADNEYKALVYYRLGEFYEMHKGNFIRAYTYYEKYTLNTKNGGTHALLLRALLLRDDFTYSDELEKELRLSYGEPDLGLRNDRLFENIGALVVARHEGTDEALCDEYIKRIKNIVKADELFFPDFIFKKDTVRDILEIPQKVFDFVNTL